MTFSLFPRVRFHSILFSIRQRCLNLAVFLGVSLLCKIKEGESSPVINKIKYSEEKITSEQYFSYDDQALGRAEMPAISTELEHDTGTDNFPPESLIS
jgi:hypothetical protein